MTADFSEDVDGCCANCCASQQRRELGDQWLLHYALLKPGQRCLRCFPKDLCCNQPSLHPIGRLTGLRCVPADLP